MFSNSSVTDANYCQMMLVAFGSNFGGEYFLYEAGGKVCKFFDRKNMSCKGNECLSLQITDLYLKKWQTSFKLQMK